MMATVAPGRNALPDGRGKPHKIYGRYDTMKLADKLRKHTIPNVEYTARRSGRR